MPTSPRTGTLVTRRGSGTFLERSPYELARTGGACSSHGRAASCMAAATSEGAGPATAVHLTRTVRQVVPPRGRHRAAVGTDRGRATSTMVDGARGPSPTRTALDLHDALARIVEHALLAMDHFLRDGRDRRRPRLRRGADAMARWAERRSARISSSTSPTAGASLLAESRTAVMLLGTGTPARRRAPTGPVTDSRQRLWTGRFAWRELGVIGEFDGKPKHRKYARGGREDVTRRRAPEKQRGERICTSYAAGRCIRLDLRRRPASGQRLADGWSLVDPGPP